MLRVLEGLACFLGLKEKCLEPLDFRILVKDFDGSTSPKGNGQIHAYIATPGSTVSGES